MPEDRAMQSLHRYVCLRYATELVWAVQILSLEAVRTTAPVCGWVMHRSRTAPIRSLRLLPASQSACRRQPERGRGLGIYFPLLCTRFDDSTFPSALEICILCI